MQPPLAAETAHCKTENCRCHGESRNEFAEEKGHDTRLQQTAINSLPQQPLDMGRKVSRDGGLISRSGEWGLFFLHVLFTLEFNTAVLGAIIWLFNVHWRVTH